MGFKLTTIEEFESATDRLLETGKKVGADSWQMRVKNQTPHCKFGEQGDLLPDLFHGTVPDHAEGAQRNLRLRCPRYRGAELPSLYVWPMRCRNWL